MNPLRVALGFLTFRAYVAIYANDRRGRRRVVVLVTPAAADTDGSLLAVSAAGTELVLLSPTGEVAAQLTEGQRVVPTDAEWSPDGRRIAFTSPPAGRSGREVWVVGADGTGLHAVTSDSNDDRLNTRPLWISPTEVVYHRRDDRASRTELRVVDVETTAVRTLVPEADFNFPLHLQPGGSLLLYTLPMAVGRGLVDIRTGERHPLPEDVRDPVAWSHDGTLLAYGTSNGLHVVRPDGTGQTTLVANRIVRDVEWAPDDRRLAFTIVELFGPLGAKFGTPALSEVYSVAVNGSGLRRLTGLDGDTSPRTNGGSVSPRWWPGGSRVFFRARRPETADRLQNWVMNADGTCEQPWGSRYPTWATPRWSPTDGGSYGTTECWSAIVRASSSTSEIGLRNRLPLTITIRNDGTEPLRNLRVALSTTRGTLHLPERCDGLTCPLGTIAPESVVTLPLEASSRTPGLLRVGANASYDGRADVFPLDDRASVAADVLACDLVGTWRADRIEGTQRRDRICGRPGDDRIDAGAGNDDIDAGGGRDTVLAGRGRDTVHGGGESDVILVRDGERDVVDCGRDSDTVLVDRRDVTRNCERVLRR